MLLSGRIGEQDVTTMTMRTLNQDNQSSRVAFVTFGVCLATMFLLVGCRGGITKDSRFYDGTVAAGDLAGIWVLDTNDVPTLRDIGYVKFTNRLDHVLLLNRNGTCAYRGFDDYFTRDIRPDFNESTERDSFLWEGSRMYPDGLPGARSWYRWTPASIDLISGPYAQTNGVDLESGSLQKNRWNQWEIQDGRAGVMLFEGGGARYRYRVRLSHRTYGENNTNFDGDTFFLLGRDEEGYFLWKPVNCNYDYVPHLGRMIRFRQVRSVP